MKKLGRAVLIVIVVLIAAYWLLIDIVLEQVIEREGSKALKAEVDVESVDFSLLTTSIDVHGIQATNPNEPMNNLVEIGTASLDVTLQQLLQQHIIAEQMVLSGLRFNQPRASSGAIPGLTPEPKPAPVGGGLPALSLPDPETLIAGEKARLEQELARIENELETIKSDWEQRVDQLPDDEKLDEYRERFQKLKGGNVLTALGELESLRKDLRQDIDAIEGLEERLQQDVDQVQQKVKTAQQLPAQATSRLLADTGLDVSSLDNLTQALLGDRYYNLLQQLLVMSRQLGEEEAAAEPAPATDWLVTVREVLIDGELPLGKNTLPFEGVAHNISSQLTQAEAPTTFELSGSRAGEAASFSATGTLDHRGATIDDLIQFDLAQLPIAEWMLADRPELAVVLQQAIASIAGKLQVQGDDLDGSISNRFDQAQFAVEAAGDNQLIQALASTLRDVAQFTLGVDIGGQLADPKVSIQSSLDQVLRTALGSQLRQQADQLQGQVRQQLQTELSPQLQNIQQLSGEISGIDQLLNQKQEALNGLLR